MRARDQTMEQYKQSIRIQQLMSEQSKGQTGGMMRYFAIALALVVAFAFGWTFGNSSAPEKLAIFLNSTFGDSRTAVAIASAIFALLSLLVQFRVGSRQAKIGEHQAEASRISADAAMLTAKNAGNRAIAAMRLSWIESLRKVLSEYHSILMTDFSTSDSDHRRLSDVGTQLDLMLNLNEDSQNKLWEVADEIFNLEKLEDREAKDAQLVAAGRAVMKAEWDKIKHEMRGEVV